MSDENRIYTRTGDKGTTGLFGGGRVPKSDPRVAAYGEVDELNAWLGWVLKAEPDAWLHERIEQIQSDLFAIGAHLATPPARENRRQPHLPPLPVDRIEAMESWMDDASADLAPLRSFILPGGTDVAAALHVGRTVCRRAERSVVALHETDFVDAAVIMYLNRLSDLLFICARRANRLAGVEDTAWLP
ncbi:MAG TPA: cob(I)yrinic acid a,c-diamide adenosyltransferase [Longimicrobiales bacterium]